MLISELSAISPIDGRYRTQTAALAPYFSEFGLIKYRVFVEIEYFIALCELPLPQLSNFPHDAKNELRHISSGFSIADAEWVKTKEKETNHDVKAVEYFIKDKLKQRDLNKYLEFIHFGLTSQDINNTAVPYFLKEAVSMVILPKLNHVVEQLKSLANEWDSVPLLAHTHGQPASPTRLGKEIRVFVERLENQIAYLPSIPFSAKFGGATGNFNAHWISYPEINWIQFGEHFVNKTLGLKRSQYTTQIEHYDNLAALFDAFKRINTILVDLDRDFWQYISMGYFGQKINKNETGSSAMPHKVNPIDFENSEGNLLTANALFEFLSSKLPVSRLQRDLTDSTVLRNIGVPFAHSLISYNSLLKGLGKLQLNQHIINQHLEDNWAVVAEAIQTILRRESFPEPYETLKALTRTGAKITKDSIQAFIEELPISNDLKSELKKISPFNYLGKN
ncbi:MAG: adenylosuccinate lyase [Cytophagales bacterium]|nr:adenylosuccinate lyase [Cytophagales bacterium]